MGDTETGKFSELEERWMICVNWYLKVSILQVQFYHPVLWLDEVGESVESLHFEMLVFHIESLQVYDRSLSPLLFSSRKICDTKLPGEVEVSITAPLDSNSLTSEIISSSSKEQLTAGIGLVCQEG